MVSQMMRKPNSTWVLLLGSVILIATAAAAEDQRLAPTAAAPVNGFPNWEERVLHQWINRARVDPAADLADCGSNCSTAEMDPTCYTPQPPLMWDHELAVASRFHSESMPRQNFFSHYTPCALREDLSDVYPGACDGSAECSCSGTGSTSPSSRAGRFGGSFSGEIIAAGYSDPVSAFYGWLHEPVSDETPCAYTSNGSSDTNGHRWLILKSSGSLGSGYGTGGSWGRYYTVDFGSGGASYSIPSGVHYPRQASTIEFWANWHHDQAPSGADLVVGTTWYPMTLERGTTANGAWSAIVSGLGTGCHRYYFEFRDAAGEPVRHPTSGTFGVGSDSSCAEWLDSAVPAPALSATATATSSVEVTWTSSSGATQYQLERSVGNVPFALLATVSGTSYLDLAVSAGETYLYRVLPVEGTTYSNLDHATTITFADDPLVPGGTLVRAIHLTQLRTAANAVRETAGLGPTSWTDPSPSGIAVKAAHVLELRSSLSEALGALGKSATFTHSLASGGPIRAVDFQELRDLVK